MKFLPMGILFLLLAASKGEAADSHNTKHTDRVAPITSQLAQNHALLAAPPKIGVYPASSIAAAASACASEPMLPGKVYYYCDCEVGAEAGCIAGSDENAGTNPSSPQQTIASAAKRFKWLAVGDSIAL